MIIHTNLSKNDYLELNYPSYTAKNKHKILLKEKYLQLRRLTEMPRYWEKSKIIIIEIMDKFYIGHIKAKPLVLDFHPDDYKCKKWTLPIKTMHKISLYIDKKDICVIEKLNYGDEYFIDEKNYYISNMELKEDKIYVEYVLKCAEESLKKIELGG